MKVGTIYFDTSSKGTYHGRHLRHNCWCAEITIQKKRYRQRSRDKTKCEEFLRMMSCKANRQ